MVDVARVGLLLLLIAVITVGSQTGHLRRSLQEWGEKSLPFRLLVTIIVGWPIIGYTTPVLIEFWGYVSNEIVGLGGEYMVTEMRSVLLLILIAVTITETVVLTLKLSNIEEKL